MRLPIFIVMVISNIQLILQKQVQFWKNKASSRWAFVLIGAPCSLYGLQNGLRVAPSIIGGNGGSLVAL
jgi:hypothetical protein